jgi:hypothetical protein
MQVEQMVLTDLMEQVIIERQLWNQLDNEAQKKIVTILGDLISRTTRNNSNTSNGEINERN